MMKNEIVIAQRKSFTLISSPSCAAPEQSSISCGAGIQSQSTIQPTGNLYGMDQDRAWSLLAPLPAADLVGNDHLHRERMLLVFAVLDHGVVERPPLPAPLVIQPCLHRDHAELLELELGEVHRFQARFRAASRSRIQFSLNSLAVRSASTALPNSAPSSAASTAICASARHTGAPSFTSCIFRLPFSAARASS